MAIYKRKEDGKWRIQVYYKKPDGSKGVVNRTAPNRKKAVEIESLLMAEYKNPTSKLKFSAVADDFLLECQENIRATTRSRYEMVLKNHLLPAFGSKEMDSIKSEDINSWKRKMMKEKSERTGKAYTIVYLNKLYSVLLLIFKHGVKKYGINDSEVRKTTRFKVPPNEVTQESKLHYWTLEEFNKFLETINNDISKMEKETLEFTLYQNVKTMMAVLFFAGLRKGEANALLVSDFHDEKNPYLKIRTSVSQKVKLNNNNSYLITNPKNKSSIREVPVPEVLATIIREHIELLKKMDGFNQDAFYLCGGLRPIADTTLDHVKVKIEKESGLPHIRVHDLRHSYATMLINCGVAINVISTLLGHANTELTWKVYSHLYPKTKNEAVVKIDELIKKGK